MIFPSELQRTKMVLLCAAMVCGSFGCNRQAGMAEENGPAISVEEEPTHHLLMENSYVRVFRAELPPGASTKLHRHVYAYVSVILTKAHLEGFSPGQSRQKLERSEGEVHFTPAGLVHGVVNTGSSPFRVVIVELLKDTNAAEGAPPEAEHSLDLGHGHIEDVVLENAQVKVTDLQIAPGAQSDEYEDGKSRMLVWMDHGELLARDSKLEGQKGQVTWIGSSAGALRNEGHHAVRVMVIEIK